MNNEDVLRVKQRVAFQCNQSAAETYNLCILNEIGYVVIHTTITMQELLHFHYIVFHTFVCSLSFNTHKRSSILLSCGFHALQTIKLALHRIRCLIFLYRMIAKQGVTEKISFQS